MKKAISLVLAFVLCLSLCACGVDAAYKPLLKALEDNNYEGIKTALTGLSPDFAAEQAELEMYHQYKDLIEALEKEDFDAAQDDFTKRIPVPADPIYHAVEITPDNWNTYFEIITVEDWHVNGFGEAEDYQLHYRFKLRDEYLAQAKPNDGVNLSVELTYTANYHRGSVDLSTREVTIGGITTNISGQPTGHIPQVFDITWIRENGRLCEVSTFLIQWDNGTQDLYVIEEVPTVTRIQGTIQLLDK